MDTLSQDMVYFKCNICGDENSVSIQQKHRELLHCSSCHSCARFRGIVKALFKIIPGLTAGAPLSAISPVKYIRGIGMSDSSAYANELERIFDYTNTYYHTAPYLDVTNSSSSEQYADLDFIISSDVLEHVSAPVSVSLINILNMLKPGGHFILTVPYLEGYETVEHFPHLNNYEIVKIGDDYTLINQRLNGAIEVHRHLCFHGGPGSVLEMRIFGEGDLLAMLRYAGFENVITLAPDDTAIGYCWDDVPYGKEGGNRLNKSHVIICQRPF